MLIISFFVLKWNVTLFKINSLSIMCGFHEEVTLRFLCASFALFSNSVNQLTNSMYFEKERVKIILALNML